MFDFTGRRVVVTGAASGIGRATAELIMGLGGYVIAIDRAPADAPGDQRIAMDMSDPGSIARAVDRVDAPVDALCNVAGVSSGSGLSHEAIFTINYVGTRYFTDSMLDRILPGGAIVCVSSGTGHEWMEQYRALLPLIRQPGFDEALAWIRARPDLLDGYPLSKRAVNSWVRAAMRDLAEQRDLRINVIAPGVVNTPMLSQSAFGTEAELKAKIVAEGGSISDPRDQAWPIAFLASPVSRPLNGQIIYADGGRRASVWAQRQSDGAPATMPGI
ncbi:MAG: SDR family oxidoreductase [Sphingobium sp.]